VGSDVAVGEGAGVGEGSGTAVAVGVGRGAAAPGGGGVRRTGAPAVRGVSTWLGAHANESATRTSRTEISVNCLKGLLLIGQRGAGGAPEL